MRTRFAWLASLDPSEPVRDLMVHMTHAARDIAPVPSWVERYPLTAMSPSARQLAWAVGRRITNNPDHGFAFVERVPAHAVGSLWPLYRAAPNLAWLYERYSAFSALMLECAELVVRLGDASVEVRFQSDAVKLDRAEEDFRAGMAVKMWRALLARDDVGPLSVCFTYPRPKSTATHTRLLGCTNLKFSQAYFGFEMARTLWAEQLPTADEDVCQRLYDDVLRTVAEVEDQAFSARVERIMIALLSTGAGAPEIAAAVGVSERTLRRRLRETGHSLRSLLERVQRREAELLGEVAELAGSGAVVASERARLLGFANRGALRNALKRWGSRAQLGRS